MLYKDVANVCALTNTICGCYTDLHHNEQKLADYMCDLRRVEYLNRESFSEAVAEKLRIFEMRAQYDFYTVAEAEKIQSNNAASYYVNRRKVPVADHIRTARQNLDSGKHNPENVASSDCSGEINVFAPIKTSSARKCGYDGY